MAEFTMPSLGADMDAGTLVEWLVAPGDTVERGQIVAVVETQKGAIDVEIFVSGVIIELLTQVGERVPVGTTLALVRGVDETDESVRRAWAQRTSTRISPRARKLAAEFGLEPDALAQLRGSGPDGAITGEDIHAATLRRARPSPPPEPTTGGMREVIGAAMARSKREIPHYYLSHTVDLEPAMIWLEARNAERPITARLLPITVLVRAVARALVDHPEFSGTWRDGSGFVPGDGIHVGLAVALRGGGLVNPAIRDADQGSLDDLNQAILELGRRARAGGLKASEFDTATITVTSLGELGVDAVFGIIVPPQVAIIGCGAIRRRAWVLGETVLPRRVIELTLSADHRASDGHDGARLLASVDKLLQTPESL